jgi:protein-tyrosine phosphatase
MDTVAVMGASWQRVVQLEGAANFRDLGGYPTAQGGTVLTGRVFRSDSLHRCSERDLAVLDGFGIRVVYDLRRSEEINEAPGPRRHVHLEIRSRRLRDTSPADLQGRDDGERWLYEDYRAMLEGSGDVFGTLFTRLVEPDGSPCVFHCLGGKDRTGMAAALLLSWLGVDQDTVLDDYELTGELSGSAQLSHVVDAFVATGIGRPAAEALLSTPRWAMARALQLVDDNYGGIGNYLRDVAGVDAATLDRLQRDLAPS